MFVKSRFLGPAVNARRSLRHFNDYWRRLSSGFATPPCVRQLPILLVHLARSFFLVKSAVRPSLEHGGDADVKTDWPHELVHNQARQKTSRRNDETLHERFVRQKIEACRISSYRPVTWPPPSFSDRRPVLPARCFPVRSPYAGWKSKLFPPFRFGSFVLRWCKCLR
jgi:hypothetical protein